MKLLNLAARVAREFSMSDSPQIRAVQKVKDGQVRDVVTALDMKLHDISGTFITERLPGCKLLSEEDAGEDIEYGKLCESEWLVVDPLDGSGNHALGMPNYGYMAAHLINGSVIGAVVVLPEHDQYIVMEAGEIIYAKPLAFTESFDCGTVYYAYPPKQSVSERKCRFALMDLIDAESAGMYRYGSACVGLYRLLCGTHMAFIGHGIRLWDAIAFLPVMVSRNIIVKYAIHSKGITLVAGIKTSFVDAAERILLENQGITLHAYCQDALKMGEQ